MDESERRLRSIERKLERGVERRAELQELVNAHVDAHGQITFLVEPVGEAPAAQYTVTVEDFTPMDYIDVGVKIGEVLHIYRSVLDNLAWHLSIKNIGRDPPPNPTSVYFPIIDIKANWNKSGLPKIRSIAAEPAQVIRKEQPFRARHAPKPEPLSMLSALNISDKHQVIFPMSVMPRSFEQVGVMQTSETDIAYQIIATGQPVQKDALVYVFKFSKPTYVNVEYVGTFPIVLDLAKIKNKSVVTDSPSIKSSMTLRLRSKGSRWRSSRTCNHDRGVVVSDRVNLVTVLQLDREVMRRVRTGTGCSPMRRTIDHADVP